MTDATTENAPFAFVRKETLIALLFVLPGLGPLQPRSYRHQPLRASSESKEGANSPASKWARRSHRSCTDWP